MHKNLSPFVSLVASALLTACSATQNSDVSKATHNQPHSVSAPTVVLKSVTRDTAQGGQDASALTLEQIMAHPDWIGRQPESPFWSADGKSVYYQQKRQDSVIKDLWQLPLEANGAPQKISLESLHTHATQDRVFNQDKSQWAWTFENNIFTFGVNQKQIRQLTRTDQRVGHLQFLNDGRISYQTDNRIYALDPSSGRSELLAQWKFAKTPEAVSAPADYVAQQQLALIQVLANRRQDKVARFTHQKQLERVNSSVTAQTIYLSPEHRLVEASLSPNGQYLIVAETQDTPSRGDNDIMPNYINDDGRIASDKVRQRVADAKPENHTLWFVDLSTGSKTQLNYNTLPGYNEDVLAQVKQENAAAKGEKYTTNRLPREIGLLEDWYWSQSAIQWNANGNKAAIMLEAWDNKDRWIATVEPSSLKLVNQHRLHDDAWVNYKFNSFGWMHHSDTLYFLSEQSGYAQLYKKRLNGKTTQVTSGQYEVDNLTLSADDQYMYFQANIKHPGIYEIYRVNLQTKQVDPLTELNGMTEYQLSDDEAKLLLTHSKLTSPPELYSVSVNAPNSVRKLTDTTSEAFKQINWQAPNIVPVASTNTDKPIYSRVYLPENHQQGEKRRAVIFNHGAGYLQNSHLGWSNYFREFMFHNLLVQQGYVVMDMDYRASAGYGRDWRTAIYRHMGKPEIEDLVDGVNYLVNNLNVDRQRIGTYGGSYGGFMTFMALFTQPDLFQAGAALRPVSDWAHYNHGYTSNILNSPEIDPIAYERSSPIYFAQGLREPLLINAPMVDSNVFFVDVVRLVQRLIELEKQDFETAIYPVESHGFVEPSSWLDEYRRIYKLFEQEL